jgi:hypothetical protein
MGDIVNLRRERKRQDRRRQEAKAAENRALFGMTKAKRLSIEAEREIAERALDSLRLIPPNER